MIRRPRADFSRPVDYEKMKKAFLNRNMNLAQASRLMGRADTYLNHVNDMHSMRTATINQIEAQFGIKYDEIKPDEPKQQPEQTILEPVQESRPDLDYDTLLMTIKNAVMLANKNTDYNALREMLAYAVETAIRNVLNDKAIQTQLGIWLTRCNSDGWKMAWREKLERQAEENRRAR